MSDITLECVVARVDKGADPLPYICILEDGKGLRIGQLRLPADPGPGSLTLKISSPRLAKLCPCCGREVRP